MSSKYEKFFTVYAYICKNSDNTGIYDVIIYIFFERKDIPYYLTVEQFNKNNEEAINKRREKAFCVVYNTT